MRNKRHQEILDIVKEMDITNQDMLIEELRKRSFIVTQPTVSRDITRLRLSKAMSDDGVYRYIVPNQIKEAKFGVFSHTVKTVDAAMNTVVIKTHAGMASAVCATLDLMDFLSIVGTIAGDDTVFVMTRSEKDAMELVIKLRKLI